MKNTKTFEPWAPFVLLPFALGAVCGAALLLTSPAGTSGGRTVSHEQVLDRPAGKGVAGTLSFNSDIPIETATNEHVSLASTAGSVRLVSMIYTHCPGVCPMTVQTLHALVNHLQPAERARLRVVVLSLDPVRDTPAALAQFASAHGIDTRSWLLGRATVRDSAALADLIGVHSRRLSDASIDHSVSLALVDEDGQLIARSHDNESIDPDLVAAARRALAPR